MREVEEDRAPPTTNNQAPTAAPVIRFLNKQQVLAKVQCSNSQLTELMKHEGFPPPRVYRDKRVGNRTKKLWLEHEVDEWMLSRQRVYPTGTVAPYGGGPPPEIDERHLPPVVAAGNAYRKRPEYEERRRKGLLKTRKKQRQVDRNSEL
jgi:predicted DNA-binding transcriptional regulator AlpA